MVTMQTPTVTTTTQTPTDTAPFHSLAVYGHSLLFVRYCRMNVCISHSHIHTDTRTHIRTHTHTHTHMHTRTHTHMHTRTHTHTHTHRVLSCMMKKQRKCIGNLQGLRYLQELMYHCIVKYFYVMVHTCTEER